MSMDYQCLLGLLSHLQFKICKQGITGIDKCVKGGRFRKTRGYKFQKFSNSDKPQLMKGPKCLGRPKILLTPPQ